MIRKAGERSKAALLNAASQLFAQRGIWNVKLSEIAELAGVDACMIHHHFGDKNGLIMSVVDLALERWKEIDMRRFYQENSSLLETREGQIIFVSGLVNSVFQTFGNDQDCDPGKRMLLQLLQYPNELRQKIIDLHIHSLVSIFCEIYRKITGKDDFESAFCWFMFLICPQFINTASPGMLNLLHPGKQISNSFGMRMRHTTTKVLLHGLGLE